MIFQPLPTGIASVVVAPLAVTVFASISWEIFIHMPFMSSVKKSVSDVNVTSPSVPEMVSVGSSRDLTVTQPRFSEVPPLP